MVKPDLKIKCVMEHENIIFGEEMEKTGSSIVIHRTRRFGDKPGCPWEFKVHVTFESYNRF